MATFNYQTPIACAAQSLFDWHKRPGAFARLTPPWESVEVLEKPDGISDGTTVVLRTKLGPLAVRWVAVHSDYIEGQSFKDIQKKGPFAKWEHTHKFISTGPTACTLVDEVEYVLPLGQLGAFVGGSLTREKLVRMFRYRHRTTAQDLAQHATYKGERPMKIAVTGAGGLIGSHLTPFLTTGGHEVKPIVRTKTGRMGSIFWDPYRQEIDSADLEGLDGIVHLSGENIAGRWTEEKKKKIRQSRVEPTRFLCAALSRLKQPPRVLVVASAIGYYGDRGSEIVTEESDRGDGFLADVTNDWEAESRAAEGSGIRVVNVRLGVILTPRGGALQKMLLPFKMGLGGVVGSGRQYWSWIGIDDVVGAIHHALITDSLQGPVNVVAPNPATNTDFTKALGRVLSRPAIFPVPALVARLAFGEMAEALLLASTRVEPVELKRSGYQFRHDALEETLRHLLGK